MRFTVVWSDDALRELAELWMQSDNRKGVAEATNRIDAQLANDAANKGQIVGDMLRLWREPPLEVIFEVIEADRLVRILDVHRQEK